MRPTLIIALFVSALAAQAADDCATRQQAAAKGLFAAKDTPGFAALVNQALLNLERLPACTAERTQPAAFLAARREIEAQRVDKQEGGNSATAGGTNLVSSGGSPEIAGLSWETAGITRGVNGQTVTFRTNPGKLIAAMAQLYGNDNNDEPDNPAYKVFSRTDLSLSFDTGRTTTRQTRVGELLGAEFQQFSEFGARAEIINRRDPRSKRNAAAINELANAAVAVRYADSVLNIGSALRKTPAYRNLVAKASDQIRAATAEQHVLDAIVELDAAVSALVFDSTRISALLSNLRVERASFEGALQAKFDQIAKSFLLTADYSFVRPPTPKPAEAVNGMAAAPVQLSPDQHFFKLIASDRLLGSAEWTATASVSFFHEARPDMKGNFRDLQLGLKTDVPLPEIRRIGKPTITIAGLYEHLHQRPLGIDLKINDVAINQPGNIGFFQAKFTIPLGKTSGVKIPLSFTASNRTELIDEREVRGTIGITFDPSKLF